MIEPINKAGNIFEGGALLVAQADPKCWVREGYTVVKSSEIEQLRAELEQAKTEIDNLKSSLEMAVDDIKYTHGVAYLKYETVSIEQIKADAICEAMRSIIDKWQVSKDHASVLADSGYVYVSNRALDEYAEKVRRGEV